MKTKSYSLKSIQQIEAIAIQGFNDVPGIAAFTLMQRAGTAAFNLLINKFPTAKKIVVFCGAGNNAGDGYILAALAKKAGMDVYCYYLKKPETLKEPAISAFHLANKANVIIFPVDKFLVLNEIDVIVDALLGTGFQGVLSDDYFQTILRINSLKKPILSIDLPSGLNAETGEITNVAIKADITMTYIGMKRGFNSTTAKKYCGKIYLDTLGINENLYLQI